MKNWTGRRKVAFWTHLIYILIPALAALVAAVRLWTFIFGEWYFAVPLILCLEGVAAIGFWFHLTKVDSPFVKARHFIPFFSVGTLGYELGAYLVGKHGWELGVPFTVFVVGVFGFLFIKSFGVLERLMIDPVQAAAEKATELTRAILIPVEEHNARAAVFREATLRLQAADRGQPVQSQITLEQIKYALGDVLAAQAGLTASVAPRVAGPTTIGFYAGSTSTGAATNPHIGSTLDDFLAEEAIQTTSEVDPRDLVEPVEGYARIGLHPNGSYGFWGEDDATFYDGYASPMQAVEGMARYGQFLNGHLSEEATLAEDRTARAQAVTEASEDRAGKGQDFGEVLVAAVADGIAWLDRGVAEVLDEKLAEVGLDRQGALELLQRYAVSSAADAYRGLRMLGKLPKGISERDFEVLYEELTRPKPLGVPCQGEACGSVLTNGQKGVATKWASRRDLGDLILCSACRAKHPSN